MASIVSHAATADAMRRWVLAQPIHTLLFGAALSFFCGKWLDAADVGAEPVFKFFNTGRQRDEGVGEWILHIVRIGDENTLAVAIDNMRGNADDGGVGRHVRQNHRAGAHA